MVLKSPNYLHSIRQPVILTPFAAEVASSHVWPKVRVYNLRLRVRRCKNGSFVVFERNRDLVEVALSTPQETIIYNFKILNYGRVFFADK